MEHQGEALRVVLTRNNVKITDLAERIKCSRTTVYTWFDMTIIPYENLEKISKVLDLDIFQLIREEMGSKSSFKKYKPIAEIKLPKASVKEGEEIMMQIKLDGKSQTLDRLIEKLRVLNAALSSYSEAVSG